MLRIPEPGMEITAGKNETRNSLNLAGPAVCYKYHATRRHVLLPVLLVLLQKVLHQGKIFSTNPHARQQLFFSG